MNSCIDGSIQWKRGESLNNYKRSGKGYVDEICYSPRAKLLGGGEKEDNSFFLVNDFDLTKVDQAPRGGNYTKLRTGGLL